MGAERVSPKLRLDAVIARGSFGVVWRARQLAVERDVAVKVLDVHFDDEPRALFQDEIRAIGTLDHPNVVRIFDADETPDGRLYFVMELLAGATLQEIADKGPVPVPRAIELVGQLLDGLAAVHAAGHIHADVKPANAIVVGERVVLIDFGLSRVRRADRPAEAVGGTRTYMAPEQWRTWEVDARSDVFGAALVLVKLVTGAHKSGDELAPPLDAIADPALRRALERALAEEPSARPSAADFARALRGGDPDEPGAPRALPPFRELGPLTERDRGRLFGRAADVSRLRARVEAGRAAVLTAPSGTGKTSLLRAGLGPLLDADGVPHVYVACEGHASRILADRLGGGGLRAALTAWLADGRFRVIVLDQLEAALGPGGDAAALLADVFAAFGDGELGLVLGVREDFVARLNDATPTLAAQVRIRPLGRAGARDALVAPLAEHGVSIAPALRERVLSDLEQAARELGLDAARDGEPGIYPPHLQLVGAALFDALGPSERELGPGHYERLGGIAAVVGEHLDRTLGELPADERDLARELLLALVMTAHARAIRSEGELLETVGARHGEIAVRRVLARLEARRLLVRASGLDGVPSWMLIHDTLGPRILTWLTVHDLDRRRAAETIRFHLRHSTPEAPSLLSAAELRRIARFPGLLAELDAEWSARPGVVWTATELVRRSRLARRYRLVLGTSGVTALALAAALFGTRWLDERHSREAAQRALDLDLGTIDLEVQPFDVGADGAALEVDAGLLPELSWDILDEDEHPIAAPKLAHGRIEYRGNARAELGIAVRRGPAMLVVRGRGRAGETCGASVLPLAHVPRAGAAVRLAVRVPTCRATWHDTIEVPAGFFFAGSVGWPPSHLDEPSLVLSELPSYRIDRTEITNGAFKIFGDMQSIHGISAMAYVALDAAQPLHPRGGLDRAAARAYCRFLGKDLPTSAEWQKAMRGGLVVGGRPNPEPLRNLPWGTRAFDRADAAIVRESDATCATYGHTDVHHHPALVGAHPLDTSPYGVVDLAGNVQEWLADDNAMIGGNWNDTIASELVDYVAGPNARDPSAREYYYGARCVGSESPNAGRLADVR
ncbi:MAG TPA: SUMF1/EgtB/PvdO family nonheme iron enzyme [Kofleriaceae bacterium]